jgi:peptidoglycan hydrolase CwlO-like protein
MTPDSKFWTNPMFLLGAIVALIVIVAAILYYFYTKLATTKARVDAAERKASDAANQAKNIGATNDKMTALTARIDSLEGAMTKLKKKTKSSVPEKKVKCDESGCEVDSI